MTWCPCLDCADGVLIDGHCFTAEVVPLTGTVNDLMWTWNHECPATRLDAAMEDAR